MLMDYGKMVEIFIKILFCVFLKIKYFNVYV